MTTPLNEEAVAHHRARLQTMETEYLLGAWQIGTLDEWTPEGLEAIRRILSDRLQTVPPRTESGFPVPPEPPDTYHDHAAVINWSFRLKSASWLLFAVTVLSLASLIPGALEVVGDVLFGQGYFGLQFSLPFIIPVSSAAMSFGLFLLLRAASQALLLLLDIEGNTRAALPSPPSQPPSLQHSREGGLTTR